MAKLGSGARFKALESKLQAQGVRDPAALAASIGRKKFGAKKFNSLAAKGRKRNLPGMSVHPVVECNYAKRNHAG